jgi:hypothetical protein
LLVRRIAIWLVTATTGSRLEILTHSFAERLNRERKDLRQPAEATSGEQRTVNRYS